MPSFRFESLTYLIWVYIHALVQSNAHPCVKSSNDHSSGGLSWRRECLAIQVPGMNFTSKLQVSSWAWRVHREKAAAARSIKNSSRTPWSTTGSFSKQLCCMSLFVSLVLTLIRVYQYYINSCLNEIKFMNLEKKKLQNSNQYKLNSLSPEISYLILIYSSWFYRFIFIIFVIVSVREREHLMKDKNRVSKWNLMRKMYRIWVTIHDSAE